VDTRWVCRRSNDLTGVVLIQVDAEGRKQTLAIPGANRHLSPDDLDRQLIERSKVLLVSTGAPREVVIAAARMANAAGTPVILDPGPPQELPLDIYPLVAMIKPNAFEAKFLTGVHVEDKDSARRAAGILLERGAGAVAIQAGEQGNLLLWQGGESWNPLLPVDVVDTTGAGDAFSAALAVSLAEGWSWEQAGPFANAAAALATTALGAQTALPAREQVLRLLR
jgi:ribokinase